jgi:diguanylate cyclase (GGDEF)-like protein
MTGKDKEPKRQDIIYFDLIMIFWMAVLVAIFSSSYNINIIQFALSGFLVLAIVAGYNLGLLWGLIFALFLVFGYGSYLLYGVVVTGEISELRVDLIIWLFMIPVGAYLAGQLSHYVAMLVWQQEACKVMEDLVTLDDVTGFLNGRGFFRELEIEVDRARRFDLPLSVLVIRIANMAEMRSVYGVSGIRSIIKAVSEQIDQIVRSVDKKGLIDIDTIALILPETPGDGAKVVAEKIHRAVERVKVDFERGRRVIKLRIAVGTAEFSPDTEDAYVLYDRARDEANKDMG